MLLLVNCITKYCYYNKKLVYKRLVELTFHLNEVELFDGSGDALVVEGEVALGGDARSGRDVLVPGDIYISYPVNQHRPDLQATSIISCSKKVCIFARMF